MQPNPAVRIPNNNTTRILSVFNLLKRVGFAVLLLGGNAFAQPFDVLWDRSGQGPESGYGARVFSLGDQNNDGFMDWGVRSQGLIAGDASESMGEFFYGGDPPQATPYHTWIADPDENLRLSFVREMGDLNGDGYVDWQVALQLLQNPQVEQAEFYLGGPDATFEPALVFNYFWSQTTILPMGDFNGDGFDDIYLRNSAILPHSRVLLGGIAIDSIPDLTTDEFIRAYPFGDLNGDGFADFLDTDENVYLGSANPDLVPEYHWEGTPSSTYRIIPDVNGDGKDELAIARPGNRVDLHLGAEVLSSTPDVTLNFEACSGGIYNVVGLGDINDDGHQDLAVIDDWCTNYWGGIAVYLGYHWINPNPIVSIRGRTEPYQLVGIFSAAGLGDVDGNGVGDFAIGAWNDDFDGERGRVVILSGDTSYVVPVGNTEPILPDEISISIFPNPFNSSTRITLSLPPHIHHAELRVHNLLGQEVLMRELNAENGQAEFALNGTNLATGVYLVSARSGESIATQKVMLLK